MASTRITKTTPETCMERSLGLVFDDKPNTRDFQKATISRINLTADTYIRSIAVHYSDASGPTRGEVVGSPFEIILSPGEFITSVQGWTRYNTLAGLVFVTNIGCFPYQRHERPKTQDTLLILLLGKQWGPYGRLFPTDTKFHWGELGESMGLLYFNGRADSYIRCLRATFAIYPVCRLHSCVLKYESSSKDTQSDPLCTFAQNLLSPNVSLVVSPDATELHVSQGILCRLAFFRAALEGQFRESTEKRIMMPDDEVGGVSALVEYLYTGHYTYRYHNIDGTDCSVREGSFHAVVYATAHKYDCQELVEASLSSFVHAMAQLKGITVIRLWAVAYGQGLVLDAVAGDGNMVTFTLGLGQLLKSLYKTDREEIERVSVDYPTLISDLLRLVVSKED